MMASGDGGGRAPVVILTEQSNVTSGIEVQEKLVSAALALGNIIRSTFGPRGLDKMLYKSDGNTAVTNDGAKIISELLVKHPAAKALVSLGHSQESTCGDGVTGCLLLATELMREAGRLLKKGLHPLIIIEGWRQALKITLDVIAGSKSSINPVNISAVAATSLVGKGAEGALDTLSSLVVSATLEVAASLPEDTSVMAELILMNKAKRGSMHDSRLVKGVILEKRLANDKIPRNLESVPVVLLTCPLEFEGPTRDSEIEITDPLQLTAFIDAGEKFLDEICEQILSTGAKAVFTTGGVDPRVLHSLSERGVFVLSDLDQIELKSLSGATGAEMVDLLRSLTIDDLGEAGVIHVERREGVEDIEDRITIDICPEPTIVTIEVGGANDLATEEVIRGLYDSLKATTLAFRDGYVVNGGGHIHCSAALAIRSMAEGSAGRERLAMESFARALETIPFTLASNAGKEGLDTVLELRATLRNEPQSVVGIMSNGEVGEVPEVLIPAESLISAITGAFETASSLLRVDQVISARGD